MSERGKDTACDFDGDDFLLVIIQQYYHFETFVTAEIGLWGEKTKAENPGVKIFFFFLQREEKK